MPASARVVRVAPLPIRGDRAAELRRVFGTDVEVVETSLVAPVRVAEVVASAVVDAVVLDVVEPVALAALIEALAAHTLLRPILEFVRTSRGQRQPVFVGYGRLMRSGDVVKLTDGELAPRRLQD